MKKIVEVVRTDWETGSVEIPVKAAEYEAVEVRFKGTIRPIDTQNSFLRLVPEGGYTLRKIATIIITSAGIGKIGWVDAADFTLAHTYETQETTFEGRARWHFSGGVIQELWRPIAPELRWSRWYLVPTNPNFTHLDLYPYPAGGAWKGRVIFLGYEK